MLPRPMTAIPAGRNDWRFGGHAVSSSMRFAPASHSPHGPAGQRRGHVGAAVHLRARHFYVARAPRRWNDAQKPREDAAHGIRNPVHLPFQRRYRALSAPRRARARHPRNPARRRTRLRLRVARRTSLQQRIRHHARRIRLCRLSRRLDQAHQDRHRGGDAAARQSAAGGGECGIPRYPQRRPLRAGARLRLSQIRVRRLRRRFRRAARHPGGSAAAASRALPQQAHVP